MDAEKLVALQASIADQAEADLAGRLSAALHLAVDALEATGTPRMPDGFQRDIEDAMRAMWGLSIGTTARHAAETEFRDGPGLETKNEALFERIEAEFIEQYGAAKVTRIFEATKEQIMRLIAKGQSEGMTLEAIAKSIREAIPQIARLRSHVIARTETHTASNYANNRVARASRLPLVKEWISIADARTRDFGEGDGEPDQFNHRAMRGVTLPLDQPYLVPKAGGGREPLMYPGDPSGSAGNVIMCRCVEVYKRADR